MSKVKEIAKVTHHVSVSLLSFPRAVLLLYLLQLEKLANAF